MYLFTLVCVFHACLELKSASKRVPTPVPIAHSGGEKILDGALVCISLCWCAFPFFVRFVLVFRALMLTPMEQGWTGLGYA